MDSGLHTDQAPRGHQSILLFSSAAEACGEALIAIILSGTGSDGATGAYMAKNAGGMVSIQDPDTAAYPGMPLALAPTTVDIVAAVDKMGNILHDLLTGVNVPTRADEKRTLTISQRHERRQRSIAAQYSDKAEYCVAAQTGVR